MSSSGTTANERVVLAALRDHRVTSRAELEAVTGLPKSTVTSVIGRLVRRGLVVEQPLTNRSGRGRPAAGLALAALTGRVGVIALSHVKIRTGVVGLDGRVLVWREGELEPQRDEQHVLDRGLQLLDEATTAPGGPEIQCGVLGVPAPFQPGVGVATATIPDELRDGAPQPAEAQRWFATDPAPALATALGVPVAVDNDANLGALGEAEFGAGQGMDNFIYVKVAEGLGTGLILNGQLYRGVAGLAGELAHIQVRDDGSWCVCGGRGCLAHTFGGFLASYVESAYRKPLCLTDVRSFAAAGEAGTRRILADTGRRVGRVLADVCVMLNPQAIIVDGMLGAAGPAFIAGVREMLDRYTSAAVARTVQVVSGSLGDRAELLGAAALVHREHLDEVARR